MLCCPTKTLNNYILLLLLLTFRTSGQICQTREEKTTTVMHHCLSWLTLWSAPACVCMCAVTGFCQCASVCVCVSNGVFCNSSPCCQCSAEDAACRGVLVLPWAAYEKAPVLITWSTRLLIRHTPLKWHLLITPSFFRNSFLDFTQAPSCSLSCRNK